MTRLLFWLACLCSCSVAVLNFKVEPKTQECLFETLSADEDVKFKFEVTRGGLLDIRIRLYDPNKQTLYEKLAFFNRQEDELNEAEGKFSFTATMDGVYSVCFDNTMSRWTPKVVSYGRVYNDEDASVIGLSNEEEKAAIAELGPVTESVSKIAKILESITTLQHHMRVKEQSHRDASEIINSRVQWLSIFESIILVSVSGFQIYYIRTWFAEGKRRGGV